MSGRKKAGSWQEGVARSFSRFFSRNPSQDKEEGDSLEKSSASKDTNQETQQEGEASLKNADSQEYEPISLKNENNTSQPSVDPIAISENEDENIHSVEEQINPAAAKEEPQSHDHTSLTPDIKTPDHDRQPKENFLQFLGNLFKITPKSASGDVKQTLIKEENDKTEKNLQDQSFLQDATFLKQEQPDDPGSSTVLASKVEAAANIEDTPKADLKATSAQDLKGEKNQETTEAPTQTECKEEAPAVTYATYRGSRRIRKLLKRQASVDSAIPEREDTFESKNTFTVTSTGEIQNVGSPETENEGYLPNKISVNGNDNHLDASHTLNRILEPNALVKDIIHPSSVDKSRRIPNLARKTNSSTNQEHELDLLPFTHSSASIKSEVCNKSAISCFVSEVLEPEEVPLQPNTDICTLETGVNSEHRVPVNVEEHKKQNELEVSSNREKKQFNAGLILTESCHCNPTGGETELKEDGESSKLANGLHQPSEMARKKNASLEHIDNSSVALSNSVMLEQESKVNNSDYPNTHTTENSHLDDILQRFEGINSDNPPTAGCTIGYYAVSRTFPESEVFNEASNFTLAIQPDNTGMSNVTLPTTKSGCFNIGTILTELDSVRIAENSSTSQDPINDLQAKITPSTAASMIALYTVGGVTMCSPEFAYDSEVDKHHFNDLLFDGSAESNKCKLRFEVDDISKMSTIGTDDGTPASIASPDIASIDVSMDKNNPLAHTIHDHSLTEDCPKLVPCNLDDNVLECNPDTLDSADKEMANISAYVLASDKSKFTNIDSTAFVYKSGIFDNISPTIVSNNASVPKIFNVSPESNNAIVAKVNNVGVAADNGSSANISPTILATSNGSVAKTIPSTFTSNNITIGSPLPSPCIDHVTKVASSAGICSNTNMNKLAPLILALENRKLTSEIMKDPDITDSFQGQVPPALESGDVCVAKISMKSVNIDEVKISPYVFQSEVVKLSRLSSTAFQPEYVCLSNLSPPPPPPLKPVNTSAFMISTPALENGAILKINIDSSTIETRDAQIVTIFPASIESGNDRVVVTYPPSVSSKDMDINNILEKSKYKEDDIYSRTTTSKDVSIDNISFSTVQPEIVCISPTLPSALKHEDNEKKTKPIMFEIKNVTVKDAFPSFVNSEAVVLSKDFETDVIGMEKKSLKIEDITIAKDALPLEKEDCRLIKQCPPTLQSLGISVHKVSSPILKSKGNGVAEISNVSVNSELTNYNHHDKIVNPIQKEDNMLGKSCLASLQQSVRTDCETNADFAISEMKFDYQSPEYFCVAKSEKNYIVPPADVPVEAKGFSRSLLHKAGEIASDVLLLSMKEIRSRQTIANPQVGEDQFRIANVGMIHDRAQSERTTEQSVRTPVNCFDGNYANKVLNVMGNDSNQNACIDIACNDISLSTETLYPHDLLALKAEQLVNEVMSFAKHKLLSDQLNNCLYNNQKEAIVKYRNPGFPENITFTGGNAVAVGELSWTNQSSTPKSLSNSYEGSEFIESYFPTFENSAKNNTSTIEECVELPQSDMLTSEENSLFSFDDSTSVESDSAEIKGDTVNDENVIKEEMIEDKWNQNNISTVSNKSKAVFRELNQSEGTLMEEVHNCESERLNSTQIAENNNSLSTEEKKGVNHTDETEGKRNDLTNLSHHEKYKQKRSFSEGGSEDEDQCILEEGHEICTPPSPHTAMQNFQRFPIGEENEDEPAYYYECANLINEISNSSDPESFVTVQAKPFRVFPFALSPIYEDDSSQEEEVLSSDISPGYSDKRSAKDLSSILSLLQSVSERLKDSNRSDEEEEESYKEMVPSAQNEDWIDLNKGRIVDGLDSGLSSNMSCGSFEDPPSFNLLTQKHLKETLPSVISGDCSHQLPTADFGIKSKSATRSVYYQYLQTAKDYSCEKGPRSGSILHEILMPKDPQLQVSHCMKTELPLVNPIDSEGLKCNPRPGKIIIYNVLCSENKLEIYNDVLDATYWTFPNEAWIRVVRGCWILYEKPFFQGQPHVLEEGETMLNNLWDLQHTELEPTSITIGSIQRMLKDGSIPEVQICSQSGTTAVPICLHSEVSSLPEHDAEIPRSITVKSGVWLAYSDSHYKGKMTILEPGCPPSETFHTDVKSLRPLKMGGLKVQMPIDPKIIIYEKNNFNGWAKTVTEHVYSITAWFNNEGDFKGIGSIRVCGGVWVAYDQERYKGHQYLLEEGEYADWHAWGGHSSAVLSLRYLQADFLESSITLYESEAEDGKLIDILNQEIPDLEQAGFCRETRSIHVQRGMWVAYQQQYYCGEQYILEKGKYKCSSDWGGNSNNILSIRPVILEPLGRDKPQHLLKAYIVEHFHGQCVEHTSEVSDFTPDMPCSFKVLQGCWLLVYQGDISDDQCVLEEGHYPDLASCGCPAARIKSLKPIDYVFAEPTISLFALDSCEGRELYFEEAVNSVLSKDLHFYTQSVWVRSGLWIAYEGANFLGKQILLESGEILNWTAFSGWKAIGSLRPVKQPAVYVKIKNRAQDKYLTVTGNLTDVRATTVCIAPYNGKNTQIWYYCRGLFKSKANNACLDVIGGRDTPGSKVALWTEHGKTRQKWRLNKDGSITSYLSDQLVLDVKGGNYYDKNSIIVNYHLEHELTQKWDMEIV